MAAPAQLSAFWESANMRGMLSSNESTCATHGSPIHVSRSTGAAAPLLRSFSGASGLGYLSSAQIILLNENLSHFFGIFIKRFLLVIKIF